MRQYPNPKAPEGAGWFTRISAKWGPEILIIGGTAAMAILFEIWETIAEL